MTTTLLWCRTCFENEAGRSLGRSDCFGTFPSRLGMSFEPSPGVAKSSRECWAPISWASTWKTTRKNFRQSVRKGLGLEQDGSDILRKDGRRVKVGAFPIGIDAEKIETVAASPQVSRRVQQIRDRLHAEYLVLAVDRLDYSKGILERLQAVERFLRTISQASRKSGFRSSGGSQSDARR